MSWSIIKKGGPGKIPTYRYFICDTIDDIATLPTIPALPAGCECYCSEDGKTYILETDGDWEVKSSSGGGGGSIESLSDIDDVDIADIVDGDIIRYDEITHTWKNTALPTGDSYYVIIEFTSADGGRATWSDTFANISEEMSDKPVVAYFIDLDNGAALGPSILIGSEDTLYAMFNYIEPDFGAGTAILHYYESSLNNSDLTTAEFSGYTLTGAE